MKRLQIILLALMGVLSVGAVVVGPAMAVEPGLLPLSGNTFPAEGVKFTGTTGLGTLTTATGKKVVCTAGKAEGTLGGKTGETTHIILGTSTSTTTGCKEEAVGCRSEASGKKDPAETVLVGLPEGTKADIHFVALLNGAKLVPGVLGILLENVVINCGGLKIEIKGTSTGEITGYTEGTDVTNLTIQSGVKSLSCDESDKLCKELVGKGLRAEAGKGEEEACAEGEGKVESKEMAVVDF
jgi:hypothetical protein